jgi:hypothetical protein
VTPYLRSIDIIAAQRARAMNLSLRRVGRVHLARIQYHLWFGQYPEKSAVNEGSPDICRGRPHLPSTATLFTQLAQKLNNASITH